MSTLASIETAEIDNLDARCQFWRLASESLDGFGDQITAKDRARIESTLAKRVRKPTPKQAADYASAEKSA